MEKEQILYQFEQIPTGNIADAMDDMGCVRQVIQGICPLSKNQPRVAGWAFTVRQLRRRPDAPKGALVRQALVVDELASKGDFIVIDNGGRMDVCTGGAILALRAQKREIKGFLVDGCLRDLDEIEELGFPIYLKGASPVRSKCDIETIEIQGSVTIGGVQVQNGDLIVADRTGIIAIPQNLIEEVYTRAKAIQVREDKWQNAIREGKSMAEFEAAENA